MQVLRTEESPGSKVGRSLGGPGSWPGPTLAGEWDLVLLGNLGVASTLQAGCVEPLPATPLQRLPVRNNMRLSLACLHISDCSFPILQDASFVETFLVGKDTEHNYALAPSRLMFTPGPLMAGITCWHGVKFARFIQKAAFHLDHS